MHNRPADDIDDGHPGEPGRLTEHCGTGPFYWQLPPSLLEHLRGENVIREEEGYLAHDVNWGRRLLDTPADPSSVPDVSPGWAGPPTPEHVSDAISAILQVAVELGMDPDVVSADALAMHRTIRDWAVGAIRRT